MNFYKLATNMKELGWIYIKTEPKWDKITFPLQCQIMHVLNPLREWMYNGSWKFDDAIKAKLMEMLKVATLPSSRNHRNLLFSKFAANEENWKAVTLNTIACKLHEDADDNCKTDYLQNLVFLTINGVNDKMFNLKPYFEPCYQFFDVNVVGNDFNLLMEEA